MNRRSKIFIAATAVAAVTAAGTTIAVAGGVREDEGTDVSIAGEALRKASAAALEHTGGGRVTETEVEDEESYYEVEVALEDGSQVDVQLDRSFGVVGGESDDDTTEDER